MKVKLFLMLVVVFALALSGCGGGDSDPAPSGPVPSTPPPSKTPQELAVDLAATLGAGNVTVSGAVITLTATTVTLPPSFSIPAGVTLKVPTGKTLAVPAGGNINNTGTITVEGTGIYTLGDNVRGTNSGTVKIGATAKVYNGTNVNISGGTNVVQAGGEVYFSGETVNPFVGSGSNATFQLASGEFSYNNGGYILAGVATLNVTTEIAAPQKLIIKRAAELTVGSGVTLQMTGTGTTAPVVGDLSGSGTAPQIVFTGTGSFSTSYSNFYYSNSSEAPVTGNTYTWTANADGLNTPGWSRP
jgi:hypothetical protein